MENKKINRRDEDQLILIVDDDPTTLDMLSKIFLSEGHWVVKAINGKEALHIANETQPDIIILDIMMPVMNGIETFKHLQKNPRTRDIPVLFLSSLISELKELGKSLKNQRFQPKPIDREKLLEEVNRLLEKRSIKAK